MRAAIGAAAVAVLLLIGWGGYAFVQRTYTTVEKTVQQREAVKAEQERQARAAEAEAEEKRKAEQVEQQRVAALRAEEDRRAKAAAEAEEKRKAEETGRQRLAAVRAEEDRRAKAAAEAEAKRKMDEAEQRRLAALKAEQDRQARAAQDAEAERIAAAKMQQEMQARAAAEAEARRPISLGSEPAHAAVDRLRYDIAPGTSDGVKAIQVRAYGIKVVISDVSVRHVGDVQFVSHLIEREDLLVASNAATAPIRLEKDSKTLSLVLVAYDNGERPLGSSAPPSLCIEGLR